MSWACSSCGGENPEGTKFCGHCGAASEAPSEGRPDVADALRSFVSGQVADRLLETGGQITEERRLVTCLFADISGFTSLADRLDPEQLLEVIDPIINRLSNLVGRYEGYVDKFAGDALLAFFGAPIAHEDDAARALLVALEMHKELEAILPELPPEARDLTLHIGVNSGHVVARVLGTEVRMDYAVLGDAVILAQRLESVAPAGETYVGPATHMLTRGRFDFEPMGEVTLKGKAEPVLAWQLVAEKRFAGRTLERTSFVGRTTEMEAITNALDALIEGRGGVVSLSGEAGVGKSRVVEEARHRAEARGVNWLLTRCISYGSSIAYWPYADLLRRTLEIHAESTPEEADAILTRSAETTGLFEWRPYFAQILGLPAPEIAQLDPEAYRQRLHEAFEAVARTLTGPRRPAVLAVEDVHWADASSIALTAHLAQLCNELPLMVLVTARPEAVPVLIEIAGGDEASRLPIQLETFDETVTEDLIETMLGAPGPQDIIDAVREHSAGNPLFVREIIRNLQDEDRLIKSNGSWVLAEGTDLSAIPPTLEGIVTARIDRLPRRTASVLQVASVIGRRVRIPLLEAVEKKDSDVADALDQLVEAGFLDLTDEGEERLVFHHAIVQDVAYSRLLRRQRKNLHLKVADAAERLYGAGDDFIDLLARHLYLGDAGPKAVDYLMRAGERARRLFSNEEAIAHFEHAVEVCRSQESLCMRLPQVLLSLADLHALRGGYDEALRLYTEVRDESREVRAWRGIASVLRHLGEFDRALSTLDEACSTQLQPDALAEVWLERALIYARENRYAEAVSAAQQGLSHVDGQANVKAHLLLQLTRAQTMTGNLGEAIAVGREAISIFEKEEDLQGLTTALRVTGYTLYLSEALDEAERSLTRGLDLARHTGNAEEIGGCLVNLELALMKNNKIEDAVRSGLSAVEHFEKIGNVPGSAMAHQCLSEVLVEGDRLDEGLEHALRALDIAQSIELTGTVADALWSLGRIHLKRGDFGEALQKAETAIDIYLDLGAAPQAKDAVELGAEALEGMGETQRAREFRSRAQLLDAEKI